MDKPVEKMTYEDAYAEIQGIVEALESGQKPLEEAMAQFERGQALVKRCADLLDRAELKVRQLSGEELTGLSEEK
jgi:exodeoxyribonuclease VII small subunit